MVGTDGAPKPGDPKYKLTLGDPPGRAFGKEPGWKKVVPTLEQLREEHPGEWACVAEWPKVAGSKHNPANTLMTSIKGNKSKPGWDGAKNFEFAARTFADKSGYGLWAKYVGD